MLSTYILKEKIPVAVPFGSPEAIAFARKGIKACRVRYTKQWIHSARKHVLVSTVFLGVDHNNWGVNDGAPIVFETMVFHDDPEIEDVIVGRCSTWEDAVTLHKKTLRQVKRNQPTGFGWAEFIIQGIIDRLNSGESFGIPSPA